MGSSFQGVDAEWKSIQRTRLPEVKLPCRDCGEEVEIQFDAPQLCPSCNRPFLGKPSSGHLLQSLLLCALIVLIGLPAWLIFKSFSITGGFVIIICLAAAFRVRAVLAAVGGEAWSLLFKPRKRPSTEQTDDQWNGYAREFVDGQGELKPGKTLDVNLLCWVTARALLAPGYGMSRHAFSLYRAVLGQVHAAWSRMRLLPMKCRVCSAT